MREAVSADSERNDAHGPSELTPSAKADHGKSGVQVALAAGAAVGDKGDKVTYRVSSPETPNKGYGISLGPALNVQKSMGKGFPEQDWRLDAVVHP